VGELADAIREHLELKRRRGADPAEVAREEHDALAPVTRGHRVVTAPASAVAQADVHEFVARGVAKAERDADTPETGDAPGADDESGDAPGADAESGDAPAADVAESDADATQEFRVEHDGRWLAADE
jgi:hypothetical protein